MGISVGFTEQASAIRNKLFFYVIRCNICHLLAKIRLYLFDMKKTVMISVLALAGFSNSGFAMDVNVSPGLTGWNELKFDDLSPNTWREDAGAIVVNGNSSVSVFYTDAKVSPSATPILRWKWRVDETPPATDLTKKGGDDRPISLIIGFAYDSANSSLGEKMKRMFVESVAGADAPGRVIDLVWGGTAPVASIAESPYSGYSGRIKVMENSASGSGWIEEEIDIAALYRSAWGTEPPAITRIAISSDGDDTGSTVDARIANIRFAVQ